MANLLELMKFFLSASIPQNDAGGRKQNGPAASVMTTPGPGHDD
jgi:hypothetical protein